MHRLSTSFVLGYHGCSLPVAESLLAGEPFKRSENDYDWLGPGIYFWQANPRRARRFALEKRKREGGDWTPSVVGAVIDSGLSLDLSTDAGIEQVKVAHEALIASFKDASAKPPRNAGGRDLLLRKLDCAVMGMLHDMREAHNLARIDTVSAIFVEGDPIYSNSGFYEKTHIQICVCNPDVIEGVFRVHKSDLAD